MILSVFIAAFAISCTSIRVSNPRGISQYPDIGYFLKNYPDIWIIADDMKH